ncbi:NAD-P-binding protein [Peniophora sp. CONT]|nr:NAD-P-binding protein [Peniophora sp. CONT]
MSQEQSVWRLSELGKGPTALKQHREPVPSPGSGQYLVRIHSVSLNYRDVAIANGTYGLPGIEAGIVLCADMAGEIVSAGERTSKFHSGDKVTSLFDQQHIYGPSSTGQILGGPLDGTLQEYRVFDEITLLRAPEYLSYDELSTFPIAAVTAWNALYGGKTLIPGQTVLLQGTGGVSMFGLLIAKAAGARTIITSSSDEKLELATKMGATHTINYKCTPDWDAEVRKLTNGVGAHHVIDNVGINEIERCFNCVAAGGVISSIGFLGGEQKATPNVPLLALFKQATLRGIVVGSKEQFEQLLQFSDFNQIHPHIDRVFAYDQAVEALQYLESAQHFGKVVIHVTSH